jgi:hypothetical protein
MITLRPEAIDWPATALLAAALLGALLVGLAWFRASRKPNASSDRAWRSQIEDELRALKEDLAQLREETRRVRAARGVAPQYGEAMALAESGLEAPAIAARCGISVAEAELIRALGQPAAPADRDG